MSVAFAQRLLVFQVLVLFVGTLMPGLWRDSAVTALGVPGVVSPIAHFLLFCGIAGVAYMAPLSWPVKRVVLFTLGLALLTEGLQFFALERHPRWIDVVIDMAGTLTAMLSVRLVVRFRPVPG